MPSTTGGCTFAADPKQDCAHAGYMWTAAADPCVLRARVVGVPDPARINLSRFPHCVHQDGNVWRVRLDLPDGALRLDLINASMEAGALLVEPAVDLGRRLEPQLVSIRRLDTLYHREPPPVPDQRLVRLVEALRAADALATGVSLRDIGLVMLGEWPGDGEHVKSRVRRRVALAAELMRTRPREVLTLKI